MEFLEDKQKISLEGAYNVRDLGGFECAGGTTAWKKYIRADGLDNLTESDIEKLLEYGVNLDMDLRSKEECDTWNDRLSVVQEVRYINIPLLDGLRTIGYQKTLGDIYVETLEECKEYFKEVFEVMLKNLYKDIIFHCSAGKDRTGMTAALLLDLVGVKKEDIIYNYTLSSKNLYSVIDKFAYENDENLKHYLGSEGIHIEKFLDYLNKKYKGTENYLEKIGIKPEDIKRLKENFTIKQK